MSKKKRLKKVRNLLIEMGSGKFFYRIERSNKNDNVEALVSLINMMAEEIEEALIHQGYANANETIKHIVIMNFILDSMGRIVAVNPQTCTILYYLCEDMVGKSLTHFLNEKTAKTWEEYWKSIQVKNTADKAVELTFQTKGGLLIPSACYLSFLKGYKGEEDGTILTIVKHSKKPVELEEEIKQNIMRLNGNRTEKGTVTVQHKWEKVRLTYEDIRKIREARDFLSNNLERELPPLKEFAREIGTNTFKLKYGFKELYGTSVFRFLRNERLRKAKMLVQYGDRPFKTIAHVCGFKSVPSFSATFKSEFGHTPTELRKKYSSENS
ncbi:helix-turn-helix domain-containing protein [Aequorivita antarctica]|uniref:Helix-turn-helix domain-containing protein n=1 Tax=Aequorivita antarctica TaxID=153266 RepID=A0A5C6YYD3_9FLAO|nr:helix-turn-helix domain-containing protein [Aequorivita antarctica]TXD72738.1 helix-turn-helix domain-containing protein [Aequorivita antarctica]SRX76363.1 Regulatory protein PchR [Aequorivita antarctica]